MDNTVSSSNVNANILAINSNEVGNAYDTPVNSTTIELDNDSKSDSSPISHTNQSQTSFDDFELYSMASIHF